MRSLPVMVVAVLAIGAWSAVAAFEHGRPQVEAWQEIAWPFPRDGWPAGRAFRCSGELCGDDVEVYVRPKIGFCNCDSGVAESRRCDLLVAVAQGTGTASGVSRVALDFLATDALTKWMTSAMDGR